MKHRFDQVYRLLLFGRGPVVLSALMLSRGIILGAKVTGSMAGAWQMMGVPSITPSFADTRTITHAIECLRSGHDPYSDYGCDLWRRLYNYPPIWLELSSLSVGPGATTTIGIVIAASTFAALAAILSSGSSVSGALIVLSLLSPPILLGLERGNVDLLIFALLVLGIASTKGAPLKAKATLRAALIIALTVLKIYPLAAASVFLRNGRGWLLSISITVTAAGAFLWAAYGHIGLIVANTPVSYWYSFGAAPLFLLLREAWVVPGAAMHLSVTHWIASATSLGCVSLLVLGRLYSFKLQHVLEGLLPRLKRGENADDVAVACLSVFVFCFVLGANFDYRLIFLMGAMPVMLRHFESRPGVHTLIAPAAVVMLLWLSQLYWSYLDELLDWLVFSGAVAWLAANLLSDRLPG
jgi:hypothetical protein